MITGSTGGGGWLARTPTVLAPLQHVPPSCCGTVEGAQSDLPRGGEGVCGSCNFGEGGGRSDTARLRLHVPTGVIGVNGLSGPLVGVEIQLVFFYKLVLPVAGDEKVDVALLACFANLINYLVFPLLLSVFLGGRSYIILVLAC